MIAGVSYGVEAGYWYYRQASLQGAADTAAYAAAIEARARQQQHGDDGRSDGRSHRERL